MLLATRQAAGMACPSCGHARHFVSGRRIGCTRCNRRWTITAGTVMADTKLPLTTWFRAMHLMSATKQAISAVELGRRLGVGYATAWYLHKRLRHAMREREAGRQLGAPVGDGVPGGDGAGGTGLLVEADDIYLGGERNQGRGTAGKTRMIAACERSSTGRMGQVAMQVVDGFTTKAVKAFCTQHIAPAAQVHTDGLAAFNAFGEAGRDHLSTPTGGRRPGRERGAAFFTINTLIANLSTAFKATHKTLSPKHLPDYLGAFWTTNRRRHMTTMIPACCRAVAASTRLTRRSVYAT